MAKLDLTPTEIKRIKRRRARAASIQDLKGHMGGFVHPISNTEDRYHEIQDQTSKNLKNIVSNSQYSQEQGLQIAYHKFKNLSPGTRAIVYVLAFLLVGSWLCDLFLP